MTSEQNEPLEGSAIQVIYDKYAIPPADGLQRLFISGTLFWNNSGPTVNLQTNGHKSLVAFSNSTFTSTVNNTFLGDPLCNKLCVESEPGLADIFTDGVVPGNYSETEALARLSWDRVMPPEEYSNWIYNLWQVRSTQ